MKTEFNAAPIAFIAWALSAVAIVVILFGSIAEFVFGVSYGIGMYGMPALIPLLLLFVGFVVYIQVRVSQIR